MPKNKKDETNLSLKDAYEEIGRSYRFFLNWRNALVAGYLVSLGAIGKTFLELWNKGSQLIFLALLCLFLLVISIFFYQLEVRNRDLYHFCTRRGSALEKELGIEGIYSKLDESSKESTNSGKYFHSTTIDWFFKLWIVISLSVLIIIGVFFCISR